MKALLIGINYRGTSSELNGCINDAERMKEYILKRGYSESDIKMLTDDTTEKPTRYNIIKSILELLQSDGQLFLHYSGHGSWVDDKSGDERDGRDETLVPIDYTESGLIVDDQLRGLLTFVKPTAKLSVVLDCCHSGTGMDLAYSLRQKYRVHRVRKRWRWRWIREPFWTMVKDTRYVDTRGQVVMLSGCLDDQYSYDAFQNGEYGGAMTTCLLEIFDKTPDIDLDKLVVRLRELLKQKGYPQVPNLTSGRNLSLTEQFTI